MPVKPRTNYLLDVLILITLVAVMASGLLLWLVYPDGAHNGGTGARRGQRTTTVTTTTEEDHQTVLGLDRPDMRKLHNWAGVVMGVLVGVHLLFHLPWIICQTRLLLGLPARPRRKPAEQARQAGR